jgi:thioredoxin 1
MIAPIIEELASELAGRVRVGKLNTDENQQIASRFGVRSIPTLLVLKDGVEIDRLVGAHPKEQILRTLEPLIR